MREFVQRLQSFGSGMDILQQPVVALAVPEAVRDQLRQCFSDMAESNVWAAESIVIFVDGSASLMEGWPKVQSAAAWSIVVLVQSGAGLQPIFVAAAPVQIGDGDGDDAEDWVADSLNLGAERCTNNSAEMSALAAALLVIVGPGSVLRDCRVPVRIYSDSQVSLDLAESKARASTNVKLVHNVRELLAEAKDVCETSLLYVAAHSGDLWNEVADVLAKFARERGVSCAAPLRILIAAKCAPRNVIVSSSVRFSLESALFWTQVDEEWIDPMEASRSCKCQSGGVSHNAVVQQSPKVRKFVTANVSTLHPAEQRMVGNNTSSRAAQLQAMAARAGAFAVGIQEARSRPGFRTTKWYHAVSSGADAKGNFGCELWIDFVAVPSESCLTVFCEEPRILGVAVRAPSVQLDFIVAHAPCEAAAEAEKVQWWRKLEVAEAQRHSRAPLVVLIDANGRLGSQASAAVGQEEPDQESSNGSHFHELAFKWDGVIVNTFWKLGQGTWQHSSGVQRRGDFICMPSEWLPLISSCAIEHDIPLAIEGKEDHFAVAAIVEHSGRSAEVVSGGIVRRPVIFDRRSCSQLDVKERVGLRLQQAPVLCDHVPIDKHEELLAKFLRTVAAEEAPVKQKKPRKSWMSEETWQVVENAARLRKAFWLQQKDAGQGMRRVWVTLSTTCLICMLLRTLLRVCSGNRRA